MFVAEDVSQDATGWLKESAERIIPYMSTTLLISHWSIGWLKLVAAQNM
jgi:hypothetical protein